ncbi:DUF456 domain-containing protein [Spirilliplanes yamanashiensis]|uniref:DUF456 domain-containing protein n=1 Tax=Spirilliplanes yamanashiensis TaxID=42233 RepID=A0A8J3YCD8_9ACTN|nr:DUF456 domain-containing protein [Spirilliplanes yamanashiensis]MDP9818848.1 uncharacterized protein YqgC (DUF456 family) [Spirilliplanes yamanashiensis]GIJ05302.1 hypothetical protein Sya03_46540 [Spirilliplanes yamanashiensis]
MDLTDTGSTVTLLSGLAVLVGVLGVVIPVLPGLLLCWGGVLLWALLGDAGGGRWLVLILATLVAGAGVLVKYLWPGRRLTRTGVPAWSLAAGGLLGVAGFFVVPVIGLPIGFVGGVLLAERARLGGFAQAWPSTRGALGAVGLSMAVEFTAALGVAALWLAGVLWA